MKYNVLSFVEYIGSKNKQEGVLLECDGTKKQWVTLGQYWFKALPGILEDYKKVDTINLDKFMKKFNEHNVHGDELIFPESK